MLQAQAVSENFEGTSIKTIQINPPDCYIRAQTNRIHHIQNQEVNASANSGGSQD
jgi:hypothetical protein